LQGITSSDWIVLNPADSLDDGETVNVKEMQQKPAPAPANSQPPSPANQGAKPLQNPEPRIDSSFHGSIHFAGLHGPPRRLHRRPEVPACIRPVPAHWDVAEPFRESAPADSLPKGEWWAIFHDDALNSLEHDALDANQTLKIAAAHLDQARASAALQVATQFPQFGTTPSAQRQRLSGNRPTSSNFPSTGAVTQSTFTLPFTVSYEVDLFGRRRRSVEAAQGSYQATAADLENTRLIITPNLPAIISRCARWIRKSAFFGARWTRFPKVLSW